MLQGGQQRVGARPRRASCRRRAYWTTAVFVVAVAVAGCVEVPRVVGDDCLKDSDCLSSLCKNLHCAASDPEAAPPPDSGPSDSG
jgi:hypothetical protein